MRSPRFWEMEGWLSVVLAPLSLLWATGGRLHRALANPYQAAIPVICVGNLVVGGTGKTPVTLAIAEYLKSQGMRPHLLSRGYGATAKGPTLVDPQRHDATKVGDEALLLAAVAPTWVSGNRAASARAAEAAGATCLILDDGLQNPTLEKDLSLIVVDGGYGFGNGHLVPAGPLREPIKEGLRRASAVVLVGRDGTRVEQTLAKRVPVLRGRLVPTDSLEVLADKRLLAFAGIGRPTKFFEMLSEAGLTVVKAYDFSDHHPYREAEVEALLETAAALDAVPVTTAKDAIRLSARLRERVHIIPVQFLWEDADAITAMLHSVLPNT